jgi:hypothetical protein
MIGAEPKDMPSHRRYIRESKRPARLYMLLATTLILAGILGYQAYDSARSHRQTGGTASMRSSCWPSRLDRPF